MTLLVDRPQTFFPETPEELLRLGASPPEEKSFPPLSADEIIERCSIRCPFDQKSAKIYKKQKLAEARGRWDPVFFRTFMAAWMLMIVGFALMPMVADPFRGLWGFGIGVSLLFAFFAGVGLSVVREDKRWTVQSYDSYPPGRIPDAAAAMVRLIRTVRPGAIFRLEVLAVDPLLTMELPETPGELHYIAAWDMPGRDSPLL
jgi:hypothetical protein